MSDPLLLLCLLCCLLGSVSGPTVLTPPALSRRWHCKPEAVRGLLESGVLKGFKVGRSHWRITLAAVEAYEQGRQPQPEPKPSRRRRTAITNIEGPF